MNKRNRYSRFNQNRVCHCCGKLTTDMAGEGTELCAVCFDSAGYENQHMDTGGEHYGDAASKASCPYCQTPSVGCMHEIRDRKEAERLARKAQRAELHAMSQQALDNITKPETVAAIQETMQRLLSTKPGRHVLTAGERAKGGRNARNK